ncbi:MAG TPA: glycoside hydrolase family 16 protein [Paludibacter sp.]|nr:glycoside hydrolase family 16 protein [Paludibacter sp.]
MKTLFTLIISFFSVLSAIGTTINPYAPDASQPNKIAGMELVFDEEFSYKGSPNAEIWSFETGFKRNEELQWYQSKNAICKNGCLIIEGKKENFPNPNYIPDSKSWYTNRKDVNYSSASINTAEKKSWLFGRFEVRARIDTTMGAWPAIWTLGISKEWPSCGEIDMLEFYRPNGVSSILANVASGTNIRYKGKWNSVKKTLAVLMAKDKRWPEKFHIWRMDWTRESIKLYVDNELLNTTLLSETINPDGSNPFLQPHYLLLNLALGANGGDPGQSHFPITFEVDYVRIYQQTDSK